jgi:subtilisin-like proprotein convertase family protein
MSHAKHGRFLPTLLVLLVSATICPASVRTFERAGRITRIYGETLSTGVTPLQSADRLRERYAPLLGVESDDLVAIGTQPVMYLPESGDYKFALVRYRQQFQEIPVFRGELRVLVRNEAGNPAVWAGSSLRDVSEIIIGPDRMEAPFAPAKEAATRLFPELTRFSTPQVVIWAGVEDMRVEPRVAWIFRGAGDRASRLFVSDIETGRILYHENLILNVEVSGNVSGLATEGNGTDACGDEIPTPMPYLAVTSGGDSVFSDAYGDYYFADGGATVEATVDGQWFDIINDAGDEETVSGPSDSDLLFNAANDDEHVRAQVNAYVQINAARDYTLTYNPAYPDLNGTDVPVHVNDLICYGSAAYMTNDPSSPTGYSFMFCASNDDPPFANMAFSSVVHHEYCHHLIQVAGSGQDVYGEGMSDSLGVLIMDDPVIGRGYNFDCDSGGRSAVNDLTYPCIGDKYYCGQVIAGCIWDTRMKLWHSDPGGYYDILGNLAINAILLHTGGSITPEITIDYLTLDDDDANLSNGTPHYDHINAGFGNHNMAAPKLGSGLVVMPFNGFEAEGPSGGPFSPDGMVFTLENEEPVAISYDVSVTEPWLSVSNGAGRLAPGESTTVSVDFNSETDALSAGDYEDAVRFTNVTNHLGDQTRSVKLDVNRAIHDATDTPVVAPTDSTASSTITVMNRLCIGDVDVIVDLDHDSAELLQLTLTAPNSDSVVLHAIGHYANGIYTTYDDDGEGTLPDGPGELADFEFDNAQGTWTLEMDNQSFWDDGTLNSWSLRLMDLGMICPPQVDEIDVNIPALVTSGITLTSTNPGGGPVEYVITSLPAYGRLSDPSGGNITSVPYTLLSSGDVVNHTPLNGYTGEDLFRYRATGAVESRDGRVNVTVGIQAPMYSFPLSTDPGWTTTGGWAYGTPTGEGSRGQDPTSGHTGVNLYGYSLTGDYADDMAAESLTSTAIDCSDAVQVRLNFQRWLGVEGEASDGAAVQVSSDGASWATVWSNPQHLLSESSWSLETVDLSPVADRQSNVHLRWVMGPTDGTITYHGWNIDDIEITGVDAPPVIYLTVDRDAISWTSMTGATGYDLLRGDLHLLRSTAGDFTQATAQCVDNDNSGTSFPYSSEPGSGEAHWFLVRGDSGAAVRTYESFFTSQSGLRDDEIGAATVNCP